MIILETIRLRLRTVEIEDIKILHKILFSNINVVKYTFGSEIFSLEQTEKFIKENCNFNKEIGLSVLEEKENSNIVGLAGILECKYLDQKDFEFGFILSEKSWGKGFATEIGIAQIDFVKNRLKAKRVLALVQNENKASIHTLKKLKLEFFTTILTKDKRGKRKVFLKNFS